MRTMIKWIRFYTLPVLLMLLIAACGKEADIQPNSTMSNRLSDGGATSESLAEPCGTVTGTLYAGEGQVAGTVSIENTGSDLLITIDGESGWTFTNSYVYAGDLENMPLTEVGDPMADLFENQVVHNAGTDSYTYTLPLDGLSECFAVAINLEMELIENGEVSLTETTWAEGDAFLNQGPSGSYVEYCVEDCCEITTESFDIYGGQDILVGALEVTNDADSLYVTYTTTGCWELEETHLYVGEAANIPTNGGGVPIPGQFPYSAENQEGLSSYTYAISLADLPECYAIAAHSSVNCTEGNGGNTQETAWSFGTEFPNTNRWGWYSEYCSQYCE